MSELHDAAVHLAGLGMYVFPLQARGKAPMTQAGFKDATTDLERISRFWRKHPDANIGLYPGPSGRLVFDLDGPRGLAAAERLGLLEQKTLVVRTGGRGGGRHRHHVHPGGIIGNLTIEEGIEVKADKGYVVVPPSVHPTGAIYEWEGELADLRPLTEQELTLVHKNGRDQSEPKPRDASENGKIREGHRHNALVRYAGRLFGRGLAQEEVLELVHKRNKERCTPTLPVEEVNGLVFGIGKTDAERRAELDCRVANVNKTFALVIVGDKSTILEEEQNQGIRFLSLGTFKDLLRPYRVPLGTRSMPLADYWLSHEERRLYKRLVFAPGQTIDGAYNLWRGFAVEPNPSGDCGLFLEHVRENVCQGNEALYRWVMGWFAQLIQHPAEKPGTSLVLRGPQGVGKTIVGKTMGVLLGEHYVAASDSRYITGRFNSHLASALLLHADEGFWAGDPTAEGKLKDLITGDYQWIELKGKEAIRIRNYLRLLVTGNMDWLVPAGMEERRFAVLDVATTHMQDHAYFAAIEEQLGNGGYRALLHHLMTFDLTGVNLRRIPETGALFEQKIASLEPKEAWLLDILAAGRLPGDSRGIGQTPTSVLFGDYVRHAQNVGTRHRSIETAVGIFLRKHTPGLWKGVRSYTDDYGFPHECMVYQFPPLAQCREHFGKAIRRQGQWEEPAAWLRSGL